MLSPTRLIGHKEYAPGRKFDPVYDMNWRRGRVAAFRPTTGTAPEPTPSEEDIDMLLVVVRTASGGYVPHAINGDRYWRLPDNDLYRKLQGTGVKSIEVTEKQHAALAAALSSELASPPAASA